MDFSYSDSDCFTAEIAEFYAYTENPEFVSVQKSFQDCVERFGLPSKWRDMSHDKR